MLLRLNTAGMVARTTGICLALLAAAAGASEADTHAPRGLHTSSICTGDTVAGIPPRAAQAPGGSEVARRVEHLSGLARDALLRAELFAGNIPAFLRHAAPSLTSPSMTSTRERSGYSKGAMSNERTRAPRSRR
jgi:hypothetical protein